MKMKKLLAFACGLFTLLFLYASPWLWGKYYELTGVKEGLGPSTILLMCFAVTVFSGALLTLYLASKKD